MIALQVTFETGELRQDWRGALDEATAGRSRSETVARALEETYPELSLGDGERAADGRLCQVQLAGRLRRRTGGGQRENAPRSRMSSFGTVMR